MLAVFVHMLLQFTCLHRVELWPLDSSHACRFFEKVLAGSVDSDSDSTTLCVPAGRLVASLILDFLQVFHLDFTLAVFQPEINSVSFRWFGLVHRQMKTSVPDGGLVQSCDIPQLSWLACGLALC